MKSKRKILTECFMIVILGVSGFSEAVLSEESKVSEAGTILLSSGVQIPYSNLASEAAKKNYIDSVRGYEALLNIPLKWRIEEGETEAEQLRRWYDETAYKPWLAKLRQRFNVIIRPEVIGGVQTDVIEPKGGVSTQNQNRVLVNLHGGGMVVGARFGGQLESVPISSLGSIKVITVDYRMAPEYRYPAAEMDVVAVYKELLKTYNPKNIGLYGCSAGAFLTGTTVSRIIAAGLPKPGAVGFFGTGPFGGGAYGDSNYIFNGGQAVIPEDDWNSPGSYTMGVNVNDHKSYPVESVEIQRQFPPTLLISGTRDLALSKTVYSHSQLIAQDVIAELHVFEGAQHCSFAQPFVDPNVPETQQAWRVIVKFFAKYLGQ